MLTPSSTCPRCQSPIPADAPGGLCPACALLGVAEPTDAAQAAAAGVPTLEELGAAFPEYEVLEVIGHGGMGVVFKACQPRLDRLIALKILPPALAAQPGFAERFTREARALARLAHPHIVAVYDFGERAGFYYLMMEFVDGVNLRQALRAGVTPEQALQLVPHICEALQFAHDHGVLHRDIKPENILLDRAGVPKLADFGIAKMAGDSGAATGLTGTGAALGTVAYMAPEQIEKPATVDHRADIYSLGVVLYEMLTGELPLGRFAAPSEKSTVNRGVDEVVMRALEKERERRQQSATEMKTQVEHAGTQAASPANSFEYRSVRQLWGLPLVHIVHGPDPRNGQVPEARGILAIGGRARGVLALGGVAIGGVAIGGCAIGLVPLGGLAVGLAAVGGLALGLLAEGGLAIGALVADGGAALGYIAHGGVGIGHHVTAAVPIVISSGSAFTLALLTLALAVFITARVVFRKPSTPPPAPPANPWLRRVFVLIVVLIVLPVMLLGLGLVIPYFAMRSAPRPASPRVPLSANAVAIVDAAHAPFIGELSQGSIELVAITSHHPDWEPGWQANLHRALELRIIPPSAAQQGWRMNGEPALEGPFINNGSKVTPNSGEQACEFVFHTKGLPPDASSLFWEIPESRSSGGTRAALVAEPDKPLTGYDLIAAIFPGTTRETQIRAGIALGPWVPIFGDLPGNSTVRSMTYHDTRFTLTIGSAGESNGGETMVTYSPAPKPGWVQRLVAITKDGKEIAPSFSATIGEQNEVRFANLPIASVAHFEFQVRPLQWVEFRGVPLTPASPSR